ncbi:MAG: sugar ABC transporter permease [Candidatus Fimimonas sp.]
MATHKKYSEITIEPIEPIKISGVEAEQPAPKYDAIDIEAAENGAVSRPVKHKTGVGMKTKRIISNTFIYIILVIMVIVWLFPFVGILLESFETATTGPTKYIIPKQWGFDNYIALFSNTEKSFGRWLLNTFVMGVFVAIFQTVFVLSMSYVLSRMRFRGRKGLMNFMLILGMFPGFLTLILLYKVLHDMGLTGENALWGLILVYVASSGMGYYVSKGFFDTIPKSLDEAARVDGATRAQVFFKITLPMAKPIVIYTILMGFMAPWGDFILASYIAHAVDKGMNVAVGLKNMITLTNIATNYRQFCAGGVVVAIPITLLFMFLQKYYVEGVTGGAVKG